jgi:hypothetical protein
MDKGWYHGVLHGDMNTVLQQMVYDSIDNLVDDPAVASKLKPKYPFGCKRPLVWHNDIDIMASQSEHDTVQHDKPATIFIFSHAH